MVKKCMGDNIIPTSTSINIIKKLYNHIRNGSEQVTNNNQHISMQVVSSSDKKILEAKTFKWDMYPKNISKIILSEMHTCIKFNTMMFNKPIQVIFALENTQITDNLIKIYNIYFKWMLVWLYVANQYASEKCFTSLNVIIYCLPLIKTLPDNTSCILGEEHVNTAFTYSCPNITPEIIIYRREEWFKVFIHETFHTLGFDFSKLNNNTCNKKIRKIFPVNTSVNLFETYCETWARIINVIFCSYRYMQPNTINQFMNNFNYFINIEILFSVYQMNKVLSHMNLTYKDIYSDSNNPSRNTNMYKEKSNILSYYIITFVLMFHYNEFIEWCEINNRNIFDFSKTSSDIDNFYKLIESKYNTQDILYIIECVQKNTRQIENKFGNKLTKSLRMSICEL